MNKITLKSLKAELENLKGSKSNVSSKSAVVKNPKQVTPIHKASVAHDIKNSYIQNLHMRSGMFYLWLVTGILGYAQKIPFISKILTLISLYYGKTTIWKILIKIRKAFVFVNACIGVYMVYKTVGFGYDNILAGFIGMGENYFIILTNLTKRMFNWFFELFDYKIVPNVPNLPNNKPSSSWPNYKSLPKIEGVAAHPPIKKDAWGLPGLDEFFKLRDSYKNVTINTSPWYTDLTNWLLLAGIATSIGVCYFGYQFMTNPNFIHDSNWFSFLSYFKSNPGNGGVGPVGPDINVTGDTVASGSGYVADFFARSSRSIFRGLNPYNWFTPAADSQAMANTFMINQASTTVYDNRFYPYTEYNPFAPLHKRLKILIIGESAADYNARIAIKKEILGRMMPDIVMGSALNVPEPSLLNSNWASRTNSPILNELRNLPEIFNNAEGISSTIASGIASGSGIPIETFDQVFNKLEAIKSSIKTSTEVAGTVYKSPSILSEALPNWAEHSVDQTQLDDWHLEHRLHTIRYLNSTPVSEATTPIQTSNKFSVLNEENI